MIIATLVATLGAGWASYGKIEGKFGEPWGWAGPGLLLAFGVLALIFRSKPIKATE